MKETEAEIREKKGGKYKQFGGTGAKGRKSFKQKGVVDSVKHCKENNKDKSVGLTKYEAIEKCCESIFVELWS